MFFCQLIFHWLWYLWFILSFKICLEARCTVIFSLYLVLWFLFQHQMIPSCILYCWKKSLLWDLWSDERLNFLLLVGMVSSALTFCVLFFLWMHSFKFSFRCAVVGFWCTFLFLFIWIMDLLLESSDSGWKLFLTSRFTFWLVTVFWSGFYFFVLSVSELFGCFVLGFFFLPLHLFLQLNLWLFLLKGFLPFPTSFPRALGRASSIGILQIILYTHNIFKCYIIYIKTCQ